MHKFIEGAEVHEEQMFLHQTGDILATFMAWLDDVRSGGATAFDFMEYEQVVEPSKGSAAFWINLHPNGYRDMRTSHGGCPVLEGKD